MNEKIQVAKAFRHLDPSQGLADGISSGFSSIRYRGKAWTLQHGGQSYPFCRTDDGSPLTYVDLIILGISPGMSKVYFGNQGDWNEDSASGPICASLKGDVPDPGVPIPQSKSCGICPHNEWITKPGGGRGKECQDHKRMAVLLMPAMTKKMLSAPLLEPVYLKIPPGSFRSLKAYSDELTQQGIPYSSVVTRISFSPDRLFEMKFKLMEALTDAEAPLVLPMRENAQTRQILGSMPEVREIAPPELPPEKIETGLLEAFGKAAPAAESTNGAKRGPGRPPKAIKPPVVEAKATPVKEETIDVEEDYEESDPDLDESVAKIMGDKIKNMLK